VSKNRGARLWDIGDGVLCVEFRTKMNAVDVDITAMLVEAVKRAEADFEAVILGNHGTAAFSAGANIMLIAMAAQQKKWEDIRHADPRVPAGLCRPAGGSRARRRGPFQPHPGRRR
jgi:3-hydroxyacyl-CoA dehydrogenase